MALVDENAYGILIGYHSIEDDEYGLERERFVERFTEFQSAILDYVTTLRVADKVTVLDLGRAVYIEFGDGDQREDPLAWGKAARSLLVGREFRSVGGGDSRQPLGGRGRTGGAGGTRARAADRLREAFAPE